MFTLWNLFEASLLCLNAVCILNEERFLVKIGWSAKSPNVGFGENPSAKSQILNLIHSIRTVARKSIIYILLTEPCLVEEALHDALYLCIISAFEKTSTTTKLQFNQIVCHISIDIFEGISKYPGFGLYHLHGIVVEHTTIKKYLRTTRWVCESTTCSKIMPIILKRIPKIGPRCSRCDALLIEVTPREDDIGDVIHIKVIENSSISFNHNYVKRWIMGRVGDYRINADAITIGNEIDIIGIKSKAYYMDVWGLQNAESNVSAIFLNVQKLRIRLQNSPWAFVQALSNIIGRSFLPSGCYIHLRMGLLLSLASTYDIPPIPILTVCKHSNIAELIINDAAALTFKCLRPTSLTCLEPQVINGWHSAGTLLLGSKGVLCLGQWLPGNKYKIIKDSIDSGVVMNGNNGKPLPLRTAVWTYIDEHRNKKYENEIETLKQVFGITWQTDTDLSFEEDIVDLMLTPRLIGRDELPIDEVRAYIESIRTISVKLADGAIDLLQKYFVCARRCRGKSLPLKSLNPLSALTKAHARLNQQNFADRDDALVAIELCEKSMEPCIDIPLPPINTWEFKEWLYDHLLSVVDIS